VSVGIAIAIAIAIAALVTAHVVLPRLVGRAVRAVARMLDAGTPTAPLKSARPLSTLK
jgi:hypothetical protein